MGTGAFLAQITLSQSSISMVAIVVAVANFLKKSGCKYNHT
jgi:hypothetical protein